MALTWSLEQIAEWQTVCWMDDPDHPGKTVMRPETHALVWVAMNVKLGHINAKNAHEWRVRLAVLERVHGAFLKRRIRPGDGDECFEDVSLVEAVERHIGLRTNVASEGRSAFLRGVTKGIEQDAVYKAQGVERRAKAEATTAEHIEALQM